MSELPPSAHVRREKWNISLPRTHTKPFQFLQAPSFFSDPPSGLAFDITVKTLLGLQAPHIAVSGFQSQLSSPLQLPINAHAGKQQVTVKYLAFYHLGGRPELSPRLLASALTMLGC